MDTRCIYEDPVLFAGSFKPRKKHVRRRDCVSAIGISEQIISFATCMHFKNICEWMTHRYSVEVELLGMISKI